MPLSGRWLRLLQALWSLLVICDLFVLMVSLPAFYQVLHTVCTGPIATCFITDQLLPQELAALQQAGISLHTYALAVFCLDLVASLAFLLVGAVIIWHRANTWMGLFVSFLLINFGSLGLSISHANSLSIAPTNSLYALASGIGLPLSILAYLCFAFFFFTFPNGRLVPRWSWILVILWIVNFVFWVAAANSPLNINNWLPLLQSLWLFIVFGGSLATQVYRYRRVVSPQRQQIKWLIYGFAPVLLLPTCFTLLQLLFPSLFWQAVTEPLYRFYYLPVPFCIGIAILRYRLWDIDLIINRTLVYGALTLSVIGLYVLVVVGLGTLIQVQGNVLLSLLATGLIAVLFQPLRLHLQRGVNRLMYGERDDPYAVLARLGSRLEATLVPEKVLPTIVETVAQALKLPYVAIALLPEQRTVSGTAGAMAVAGTQAPDMVASYGAPTADPMQVPLMYQAETIGYLLLAARAGDTFGKADERLLTDLARQAGVAVYAVRLTTHLQHLTESLQQARERLVTTREEERRRLRRDLHDGLGPALASLTFKVDAARNLLVQDSERAEMLLAEVRQQAQEAITDIRRLVYNLRPPALDEFGLLSALHEQAALYQHQGLEVVIDVPDALPPLPAAVEVAVYRIAQEALTNAARHAQAQHCLLRLALDVEAVQLDISDDGQGIPANHRIGVGLHTMHERASELGGSCIITPGSPGGPTIQVRLPLTAARDALPTPVQHTVQPEQESIPVSDMSLVRQED
jgi:signal transduction histidine kinase